MKKSMPDKTPKPDLTTKAILQHIRTLEADAAKRRSRPNRHVPKKAKPAAVKFGDKR